MEKRPIWQDVLTGILVGLGGYGVYKSVKKEAWDPWGAIRVSIFGGLTVPAVAAGIRKMMDHLGRMPPLYSPGTLSLTQLGFKESESNREPSYSEESNVQSVMSPQPHPPISQLDPREIREGLQKLKESLKDIQAGSTTDETASTWLEILRPGSIILILGRRGSGKSCTGHKMLEYTRYRGPGYVVGFPKDAKKELPEWIGIVPEVCDVPFGATILLDEGPLLLSSRESMSERNRRLISDIALARQRTHTLIIASQDSSYIDRNIVRSLDALLIKEPAPLQVKMDRPELREYLERAAQAFGEIKGERRGFCYVAFSPSGFSGVVPISKAAHWTEKLSIIYAMGVDLGSNTNPKALSKEEKMKLAWKLYKEGWSLRKIAPNLGVSKSTVGNWIQQLRSEQNKAYEKTHQHFPSLDILLKRARDAMR